MKSRIRPNASKQFSLSPRTGEGRGEGKLTPTLAIRNRQRARKVDLRLLRRIVKTLLSESLQIETAELCIHLVAATEMAHVNKAFLNHEGSTDVITFDHSELETRNSKLETILHGELFICLDDAIAQAKEFRTTWQSEVVRYLIHGILHLLGHDDHAAAARRKMKREENRLLRQIAKEFPLARLAR